MLGFMLQIKRFFKLLKKQRGAALIPIVVGSGAVLVALAGLSQIMTFSQNAARTYNRETEADLANNEIREALMDPAICNASISSLNIPTNLDNVIPSIQNGLSALYSPGDNMLSGYNRLFQITQLANPAIAVNSWGTVNLRVEFDGRGTLLGSNRISRTFQIDVTTNAAGAIQTCQAVPFQPLRDCLYLRNGPYTGSAVRYSPFCPAGYQVTGGGKSDGDISASRFTNTLDWIGAAAPQNRWRCYNNDGGGLLYCWVVCCR